MITYHTSIPCSNARLQLNYRLFSLIKKALLKKIRGARRINPSVVLTRLACPQLEIKHTRHFYPPHEVSVKYSF